MVKQGDTVKVNDIKSVVTSQWGQGKHKVFALADGRQVLDLTDEHVVESTPAPSRAIRHERMPRLEDDHEE